MYHEHKVTPDTETTSTFYLDESSYTFFISLFDTFFISLCDISFFGIKMRVQQLPYLSKKKKN